MPMLADRVRETTATTGTGTLALAGTSAGYRGFVAAVGNAQPCYYAIEHQDPSRDEWEVGTGTVTDGNPDTLSRDAVHSSSNGGNKVDFSAGTKTVFVTLPAAQIVTLATLNGNVDHGSIGGLADDDHAQYHTAARALTWLQSRSTSDLPEGARLYYTDVRADARITAQKGLANGVASLDAGGKVPTSQLPALAITTVAVVASQAAQLALTAQAGDVAVRTDLNKSFIHNGGTAGTMADWQELLTPTDLVYSVNGQTGAVVLTTTNINEGTNQYFTNARARAAITTSAVGLSYDSGTGVIAAAAGYAIPTSAKQTTWDNTASAYATHAANAAIHFTQASIDHGSIAGLADDDHTQYHTDARALAWLGARSTSDLPEGTRLYYTDARARAALSATGAIAYNSASGQFSVSAAYYVPGSTEWNINATMAQQGAYAYEWGNHAAAGYLTAEADTLATVAARGASTTLALATGGISITDNDGARNYGLNIARTLIDKATLGGGLNVSLTISATSANAIDYYGLAFGITVASTDSYITGNVFGQQGFVYHSGHGTLASATGIKAGVRLQNDGGITNAYGLQIASQTNAGTTGAIGTAYGALVNNFARNGSGAITTQYGLYLAEITGAGTNYAVRSYGGQVVWNENGGDNDFRIEGDTNPNLLVVDASTDRIGIGTSAPVQMVDVRGNISARLDTAKIYCGEADDAYIAFDGTQMVINSYAITPTAPLLINNGFKVHPGGYATFVQAADADAPVNSVYYSSTQAKLCYKDPGGTVRTLY